MNGLPRCTTGPPNFLAECSQQPKLANLLNGCLESMMFDCENAIGLICKFTHSCFLPILMNGIFLPDVITETPHIQLLM